MKYLLLLFALITVLVACNETTPAENQDVTENEDTTVPVEENSEETALELPVGHTATLATYKSCAVYAGATDYYFMKEDGEGVDFRISNKEGYEEEELKEMIEQGALEGMNITLHEQMLDPSEEVEGPPGANPELIDKEFLLIYNEKMELVDVKLANK